MEYVVTMNRTQYGLYQGAVSILRGWNEEKWEKAVFWVFDAPDLLMEYEVTIYVFLGNAIRNEWNFCKDNHFLHL
jgi:hypothetical protein